MCMLMCAHAHMDMCSCISRVSIHTFVHTTPLLAALTAWSGPPLAGIIGMVLPWDGMPFVNPV